MAQETPRYVWGLINPTIGVNERESNDKSEPLLPPDVAVVSNGLGISDYTVEGVEEAMARYDDLTADLVSRGAQRVVLAGIPISVQLGRKRVLELMHYTQERFGVPGDAAAEAVIAAMHHLGVSRVAVGSRWADEVNNALIRYFAEADIEVLAITSEGQWAEQGSAMSFDRGVRLAFDLGRQAMREAPASRLVVPSGRRLAPAGRGTDPGRGLWQAGLHQWQHPGLAHHPRRPCTGCPRMGEVAGDSVARHGPKWDNRRCQRLSTTESIAACDGMR